MLIVKLIVLCIYIIKLSVCFKKYCQICANHTLCLYNSPGPSNSCELYDVKALLTEPDIDGIVNTINERRNFIAMGFSSYLPQAANMRKIVWSPELATIAQRWVDQCDPTTQPDKDYICRDLVRTKVGQNIATIYGPTPGIHIKSFVELWFIPILKYQGSVSYYNQSEAHGTNYFTQLIWADTQFVGCGKARFYVAQRNMIIERLVCNFAPNGNIYGKPIYAVGYPATQCPNYTLPDRVFCGLCGQQKVKIDQNFSTSLFPVNSLLRIHNLSNDSMKQEIDPLRNYLKHVHFDSNKTDERRKQKMRHVLFNNTIGDVKRISSLQSRNSWNLEVNNSHRHIKPIETGHSRVYHGYESRPQSHEPHMHNYDSYVAYQNHNNDGFRRHEFTSEKIKMATDNDFKKNDGKSECTRKQHSTNQNCVAKDCSSNTCTRGDKCYSCAKSTPYPTTICKQLLYSMTDDKCFKCNDCPCVQQRTAYTPNPKHCSCNVNCHCISTESSKSWPNVRSADPSISLNYGVSPYMFSRKGDQISTPQTISPVPWPLSSSIINNSFKLFNKRRRYNENYKEVKHVLENPNSNLHDTHYFDNYFDSSERKKRQLEDQITFKPFWQMEEINYKKPAEVKSIRYTTLGLRKGRKSKRTTNARNTESITISLKDLSTNNNHRKHLTEKYLSFEELMHIRKMTSTDTEFDVLRRVGNDNILRQATTTVTTTSSASTTSEYTTNTPFVRKKHCTRKLTCTWTALAITGADGSAINGSGLFDRGSRTPPGYVEGCSRTSTCTREFMDRNQMASVTENESSSSGNGSPSEEEDYCERRALNIRRRDSGQESIIESSTDFQTYTSPIIFNTVFKIPSSCSCNEKCLRMERHKRDFSEHIIIN